MPIKFRKRVRFGPLQINTSNAGITSYSLRVGPYSWNSRTRKHTVNLPGPFSWTSKGKKNSNV